MKKILRKMIGIICLAAAAVCIFFAVRQYNTYEEGKKEYVNLIEQYTEETNVSSNTDDFQVDWESLYAANTDIVGWIRLDSGASYPVVQGDDNSFYLTRGFHKEYNINGAIFMNSYNKSDWTDANTVIYGHQMGEGVDTMFHTLDRYLEEGYIEKYPNVIIYTPDHVLTYRIFAAVIYDDRHLINSFNYVMDDQRQAFLDSLQDSRDLRSRYSDIESVGTEDRILSLSTCVTGESNHRLLVEAVLTNEE